MSNGFTHNLVLDEVKYSVNVFWNGFPDITTAIVNTAGDGMVYSVVFAKDRKMVFHPQNVVMVKEEKFVYISPKLRKLMIEKCEGALNVTIVNLANAGGGIIM